MVPQTRIALSREELASFARKLDGFIRTLRPREAEFVNQMLADAADAANEDPSGYANLLAVVGDADVEGHALGVGPAFAAVAGYAAGVEKEEAELDDIEAINGEWT
jgi:hypothetical protein